MNSTHTIRSRISTSSFLRLIVCGAFFLAGAGAWGATRTASVTGNWSSTTTWGGASAPVSGDDVIINSGITVTLDVVGLSLLSLTDNGELDLNGNTLIMSLGGFVSGSGAIYSSLGGSVFDAHNLATIAIGSLGVNGVATLDTYYAATTSTTLTGDWDVSALTGSSNTLVFSGGNSQNFTFNGVAIDAINVAKSGGGLNFTDGGTITDLQAAAGAYSLTFNAAMTVTNASTLSNTGGLNLNGGAVTYSFQGGLSSASASTITVGGGGNKVLQAVSNPISIGPVSMGAQFTIRTSDTSYVNTAASTLTINGNIAGGGFNLYLYSIAGDTNVIGNITNVATLRPARNNANSTGTITFQGAVSATQITTYPVGYDLDFQGAVNATSIYNNLTANQFGNSGTLAIRAGAAVTNGFAATAPSSLSLGGAIQSTNAALNLANASGVSLVADTTLNSGTATTTLGGAITGNSHSLTLNAMSATSSTGGAISGLTNLTLNTGNVFTLGGNAGISGNLVLTSGTLAATTRALTVSGDITRGAGLITSSGAGTVTLDGSGSRAANFTSSTLSILTINNAAGDFTITAPVNPITTVNVTNSNGTIFSNALSVATLAVSDTAATKTVDFQGNLTVSTNMTVANSGNAYNLRMGGATNSIAASAVTTFGNTGTLTIASSSTTFALGATATVPNPKYIAGTITATSGNLSFGTSLTTVTATADLRTAGGGTITLAGVSINAGTLTLGNGAATTINTGAIDGTATTNLTINTTGVATIGGAVGTTAMGTVTVTQSGGTTFSLGVSATTVTLTNTAAAQTILFSGNLTATSMSAASGANYIVSLQGATNSITGTSTSVFSNSGGLTVGAADGNIATFNGGLTSTSGTNTFRGTVQTGGAAGQNILLGTLALAGATYLDAGSTGTITVNLATTGAGHNLTITNSDSTTFTGAVGASGASALGTVTLTDTAGTIAFDGGLFASSLLTAAQGYSLTIRGGSIGAAFSATNAGALLVDGSTNGNLTFAAGISIAGGAILSGITARGTIASTSGDISLNRAMTLANTTAFSPNGNTLTIGGTLAGAGYGLTINSVSATSTFGGAVTNLGSLTLDSVNQFAAGGNVTITGALTLTTGTLAMGTNTLNVGGAVTRGAVTPGHITSGGLIELNGSAAQNADFTGSTVYDLTVSNTTSASLTATGGTTVTRNLSVPGVLRTGGYDLGVTGTATVGGTLNLVGSGSFTVSGSALSFGTTGILSNAAGATVVLNGGATQTLTPNGNAFGAVTISGTDVRWTGTSSTRAITVSGVLNLDGGSAAVSLSLGAYAIANSGTVQVYDSTNNVTVSGDGSSVNLTGTAISLNSRKLTLSNFRSPTLHTVNVGESLTLALACTLSGGLTNHGTLLFSTGTPTLSVGAFTSDGTITNTVSNTITATANVGISNVFNGTITNGHLVLAGATATLNAAVQIGHLQLSGTATGASLTGSNLSLAGGLTLDTSSVFTAGALGITVAGTTTINGTLNAGSGTDSFAAITSGTGGTLNASSGSTTISAGMNTVGFNCGATGSVTLTGGSYGAYTFNDLIIAGGALTATADWTVNRDWTYTSGTFTWNNHSLILATATAAEVSGSASFYGLSCTVPGKTVSFEDNSIQTVSGLLDLEGDNLGNLLVLNGIGSAGWSIYSTVAAPTLEYLSVSYGNVTSASSADLTALTSYDAGSNNTKSYTRNWKFGPTSISWSTSAVTSTWDTGANWQYGYVPNVTDSVTIPTGCSNYPNIGGLSKTLVDFTLNGTLNATLSGSITLTGNLVVGALAALGNPANTHWTLSTAGATISSGLATTIGHVTAASSGTVSLLINPLTITSLTVSSGSFSAGGLGLTVTGAVSGSGTLVASSGTTTVGGNITVSNLTPNGGTLELNGSAAQSLNPYSLSSLYINNSSGVNAGATDVAGTLTLMAGTLAMGSNDLTLSGPTSSIGKGGGSGTISSSGYLYFTGTGAQTADLAGSSLASATIRASKNGGSLGFSTGFTVGSFAVYTVKNFSLSFNTGSNQSTTITNAVTFDNTTGLTLGNEAGDSLTFTNGLTDCSAVTGGVSLGGGISASNAVLNLNAAVGLGADTTLQSGTGKMTLGGIVTGNSHALTINACSAASVSGGAMNALGNFTLDSGAIFTPGGAVAVGGNLALTSGTLTMGINGLNVAGNITSGGAVTFTTTGTCTLNGGAAQNADFTGSTLRNLTVTNATGVVSLAAAGGTTIGGNLTVTTAGATLNTSTFDLSVGGAADFTGATLNAGTAGTKTFSGNLSLGSLTGYSGATFVFNGGSAQAIVPNGNTFGVVQMTGTGGVSMVGTATFASLTVNSGETFALGGASVASLAINGAFQNNGTTHLRSTVLGATCALTMASGTTITNDGTLDVPSSTAAVTLAGASANATTTTFTLAGTNQIDIASGCGLTLSGMSTTTAHTFGASRTISLGAAASFTNGVSGLTLNGNASTQVAVGANTLTVTNPNVTNGTLTVSTGRINAASSTLTIGAGGTLSSSDASSLQAQVVSNSGTITIATVSPASWSVGGNFTSSGTVNNDIANTIAVGGNLSVSGAFNTPASSTFTMSGASTYIDTTTQIGNLTLVSGATGVYVSGHAMNLSGNLVVPNNASLTDLTNSLGMSIGGNASITSTGSVTSGSSPNGTASVSGTTSGTGAWYGNSGALVFTGNFTLASIRESSSTTSFTGATVTFALPVATGFIKNGGTVQLSRTSNQSLTTNGNHLNNLSIVYNTAGKTVAVVGALYVDANLEVGQSQILDLAANTVTIAVGGTTNAVAGTTYGQISQGSTATFSGDFKINTYIGSASNINFDGSCTSVVIGAGGFTCGTSTAAFSRSGTTTLSSNGAWYALSVASGTTVAPQNDTTVNQDFTLLGTGSWTEGGRILYFASANAGVITDNGALVNLGDVRVTGTSKSAGSDLQIASLRVTGALTIGATHTLNVSASTNVSAGSLTLNGAYSGGSATFDVGSAAGTVTVQALGFAAGPMTVSAGGTFSQSGANASTIASLNVGGVGASCTWGSGTLNFSPVGAITQTGGSLNLGSITISGVTNLSVTGASTITFSTAATGMSGDLTVNTTGTVTPGAGIITMGGGGNIAISTGPIGPVTIAAAVTVSASGAGRDVGVLTVSSGSLSVGSHDFQAASASVSAPVTVGTSGLFSTTGSMIVNTGTSVSALATTDGAITAGNGLTINGTGSVSVVNGALIVSAGGLNIAAAGGNISSTGSGTITVTGAATNAGTITGGGLVTFNNTLTNSGTYNNGSGGLRVIGNADFTGGTLNGYVGGNPDIEFDGNVVFGTFTHNDDVIVFGGAGDQSFNSNGMDIANVRLDKTSATATVTLAADVMQSGSARSLAINEGILALSTYGWLAAASGTVTAQTFTGSDGSLSLGTPTSAAGLSCVNLSIVSGYPISNSGVNTLTVSGNASIAGIFNAPDNSTLAMTGSGNLAATVQIGTLEVSGSTLLGAALDLSRDLVIDATGVLDVNVTEPINGGYALQFSNNWTNNRGAAGFLARGGTVTVMKNSGTVDIRGTTTWHRFVCEKAGITIAFDNNPAVFSFSKLFRIYSSGASITLTRLSAAAGDPTSPYYSFPADDTKFWDIDILATATLEMNNVVVYYSNAYRHPIIADSSVVVGYGTPYFDYKWLSGLPLVYSYTEDTDGNGKIDRIRVQAAANIGNDFSGFVASVTGYTVKGYSQPSAGSDFYILLQELSTTDTGATPNWVIKSNTSLKDAATNSKIATLYNNPMIPCDTSMPRIAHTLTLPSRSQVFVHASEPLFGSTFTSSIAAVNSSAAVTTSGGGTSEYMLGLASAVSAATIAGGSATVTVSGAYDGGTAPSDAYDGNPQLPHPTYPTAIDSYTGYSYAPALGGTGRVPPYPMTAAAATHRVSDLMIDLPPPASGTYDPATYFCWPIYAKDQIVLTLTDDAIASLTAAQSASQGIGLIRAFDGSQWLRPQAITLQSRVSSALGTNQPSLLYDTDVASSYIGSRGLWLPPHEESDFSGIDAVPNSGAASRTDAASVSSGLWNITLPADDAKIKGKANGAVFNFFFSLGASPSDLYVARLDIASGAAVPDDWYAHIKPFSFSFHGITEQKGGVTILNNVIDPTRGETARLNYKLATAGAVTATVFTLDGDIVTRLVNASAQAAGEYTVSWNGRNLAGDAVARGIYFVRIVAPGLDEIRKVLVVRK